jgi:DNA-binding response OmpR family regulator
MCAKILVVDDEEALVLGLRQALILEFPGNQVDAAYSGEEALSLLADTSYDLIIADYRMPGFSGLELIKGVRYLDGHVPIILITGFGSDEVRAEAQRLAVNYYIEKPFDVEDLLGKAEILLPEQGSVGG